MFFPLFSVLPAQPEHNTAAKVHVAAVAARGIADIDTVAAVHMVAVHPGDMQAVDIAGIVVAALDIAAVDTAAAVHYIVAVADSIAAVVAVVQVLRNRLRKVVCRKSYTLLHCPVALARNYYIV